jgi:hypothetical protein
MNALQLIQRIEDLGGVLRLNGDRVRYELPEDAETLLPELRRLRDDVRAFLKERWSIPPLPNRVLVVDWHPKQPPVALTQFSIVGNVQSFILASLGDLKAALAGKEWLAGNRVFGKSWNVWSRWE